MLSRTAAFNREREANVVIFLPSQLEDYHVATIRSAVSLLVVKYRHSPIVIVITKLLKTKRCQMETVAQQVANVARQRCRCRVTSDRLRKSE
jgi:hypothetical protein